EHREWTNQVLRRAAWDESLTLSVKVGRVT
ncbi:hypothetical protein MPER_14442, partial [Moniliophthora perniciosa FA553]